MDDRIIGLVNEAKALNSKAVTLPRLLILASLENLGEDGAAYRELGAGLSMKDGILYSNLKALESMGCINEKKIREGNRSMKHYSITSGGRETLDSTRKWFANWLKE